MTEEQKKVRAPDYSGDGIAVWVQKDKNNKTYLSVRVLQNQYINCFKVETKPVEEKIVNEAGYTKEINMHEL